MNTKKLVIASIASFVVMFGIGGAWHLALMQDWYTIHVGLSGNTGRPEPILWCIALGTFMVAFIMSLIYPKFAKSNKVMSGIKFGLLMGFMAFVPLEVILYGATTIFSKMIVIMDAAFQMTNGAIGGIVIAYCYGDSAIKK